jgi:glycopeptide antibiotics resistance protein
MIDKWAQYFHLCFSNFPTSVNVGLLFFSCLGIVLLVVFLGWKKGLKWTSRLLLSEYIILILLLTVVFRESRTVQSYNLMPFWSYRVIRNGNELLLTQAIMNVVAFIPIGVLLGLSFSKMKWWKVILIGGAFSVMIEALQFFLWCGFTEFDDVFHNVFGCLIGYGVYVGIASIFCRESKR